MARLYRRVYAQNVPLRVDQFDVHWRIDRYREVRYAVADVVQNPPILRRNAFDVNDRRMPSAFERVDNEVASLSQGVSQGMSQGVSQGMSQGVSQGMSQGVSQGMSQGVSQGMSQGVSQGMSQGVSQGMSQGVSQGMSQGVSGGASEQQREKERRQREEGWEEPQGLWLQQRPRRPGMARRRSRSPSRV
ncbi:hypothetical protein LTS15_006733 [Exophiala xenobiotica]|nr:hypothetical protein LTS15_006733 [Exophiala xenobiotica]